jgi:hypothetical protein
MIEQQQIKRGSETVSVTNVKIEEPKKDDGTAICKYEGCSMSLEKDMLEKEHQPICFYRRDECNECGFVCYPIKDPVNASHSCKQYLFEQLSEVNKIELEYEKKTKTAGNYRLSCNVCHGGMHNNIGKASQQLSATYSCRDCGRKELEWDRKFVACNQCFVTDQKFDSPYCIICAYLKADYLPY